MVADSQGVIFDPREEYTRPGAIKEENIGCLQTAQWLIELKNFAVSFF